MHMRLCWFAARAELRNDHRQSTAVGNGICANQITSDMGRDCFRNKRLPNLRFLTLSYILWGLRLGDDGWN